MWGQGNYSTLIFGFLFAFSCIGELVEFGKYTENVFLHFQSSSMFFLLAYLIISYYKGISNLPLKYTVYFSYVYIFLSLLSLWIIPMSKSKNIPLQTHILIQMVFIGVILIAFVCSLLLNKILTRNSTS